MKKEKDSFKDIKHYFKDIEVKETFFKDAPLFCLRDGNTSIEETAAAKKVTINTITRKLREGDIQ